MILVAIACLPVKHYRSQSGPSGTFIWKCLDAERHAETSGPAVIYMIYWLLPWHAGCSRNIRTPFRLFLTQAGGALSRYDMSCTLYLYQRWRQLTDRYSGRSSTPGQWLTEYRATCSLRVASRRDRTPRGLNTASDRRVSSVSTIDGGTTADVVPLCSALTSQQHRSVASHSVSWRPRPLRSVASHSVSWRPRYSWFM